MEAADSAVLDELGHVLSLAELAEGETAGNEACPDIPEDGSGLDDVVPSGSFCQSIDHGLGQGWRYKVEVADVSGLPGAPQATGPPSLSN
jgi:hypothetical protein